MAVETDRVYEFGPFRVDTASRVLARGEEAVPLPPKAFDLLVLMIEGQGRALSKKQLMSALWPDTFVEEANLSFQISTLRKALGDEGTAWIETVPKHGYRFAAPVIATGGPWGEEAARAAAAAEVRHASRRRAGVRRWHVLAAAAALAAAAYVAYLQRANRPHPGPAAAVTHLPAVPLTSYPGFESDPSLSPDGN